MNTVVVDLNNTISVFRVIYNKSVRDHIFCVTQFNILQTKKYEYISINLNCNNEEEPRFYRYSTVIQVSHNLT